MSREHRAVSHKRKKITKKREKIALTPRDKAVMRELGNSRFETAGGLDYDDPKLPPMSIRVERGVPGAAFNPVKKDLDYEVVFHTHPQTLKKFKPKSREYRIWVRFQTFFSGGDLNSIINWSYKKYKRTLEFVVGPAGDIYESRIFDTEKLDKWMKKGDILDKWAKLESDAFLETLETQNLRWLETARIHDILFALTSIDDTFTHGTLKTDLKITAKEEKLLFSYIDLVHKHHTKWLKTIGIRLRLLPKDTVSYLDVDIKHSPKRQGSRRLQKEFREKNKPKNKK